MFLCQILNNVTAILASYQTITNQLNTELDKISYKFTIPSFDIEQQTMFICKSKIPKNRREAYTSCLDYGTVLFYIEDIIDLKDLMQKHEFTKIWYNANFVEYAPRTLSPDGLRVALTYSTGVIKWDLNNRLDNVADCITLELKSEDLIYQKTPCSEKVNYFCYQRLTVTPSYLQDLEFTRVQLKSQLTHIITDLLTLTELWNEQIALFEDKPLPDPNTLNCNLNFQKEENTNYLQQPKLLTTQFHTAVMKDEIGISILLYLYTSFEQTYFQFKTHVHQILNKPHEPCQAFSLNKATRFLHRDSDTLVFQFSDTMEIYDSDSNDSITVIMTNLDNNITTNLGKDDDFYDISLPDIILSIGTIIMVFSTIVEIIRRQLTKQPEITIHSENYQLTPIPENTMSVGIQLDTSDLIFRQSLADMSGTTSSSENSDSLPMFFGIKEKARSYFSKTQEPKTVRFAPSNPPHQDITSV